MINEIHFIDARTGKVERTIEVSKHPLGNLKGTWFDKLQAKYMAISRNSQIIAYLDGGRFAMLNHDVVM